MKYTTLMMFTLMLAFVTASPPDSIYFDLHPVVHAKDNAAGTKGNTSSNGTKSNNSSTPKPSANSNANTAPCFPMFAQVRIGQKNVPIHLVKEGDIVAVGNGRTSPVFLITHNDPNVQHEFITLTTENGAKLTATSGHYVPVGDNGMLVAVGEIKMGDLLTLENGSRSSVVHIGAIYSNGLYSLQTAHGDIVIDGVVASTYTTAAHAKFSHAALLPLRASFASFGIYAKWNNYWADVARNSLGVKGQKIAF